MFGLFPLGCADQRNPMPIADHAELNEACAKIRTRKLLDAVHSVGARRLSSATHALKPRPGGPIKPDGAGDGIPDVTRRSQRTAVMSSMNFSKKSSMG